MSNKKRFFNALQIYLQNVMIVMLLKNILNKQIDVIISILICTVINITIYKLRNKEKKQWKLE